MDESVFICYSRKNEDFVLKLADNLKREGVPVWLDQWDIVAGTDWDLSIDKALHDCKYFLIILSLTSIESKDVRSELRTALDENKLIVPILYQSCQIPRQLKLIQYVDFTSSSPDDELAIEQILKALGMPHAQEKRGTEEQVTATNNQAAVMIDQKSIAEQQMRHDSIVLRYRRFQDEMDKRVAPLNSMERTGFEYYEPAHLEENTDKSKEATAFWNDVKKNAHLASDYLYEAIEKYTIVYDAQKDALRKVRYEISSIDSPTHNIITRPAPVNEGFDSYLQELMEHKNERGADTDYGKKVSWLIDIVQDGHMYVIKYKDRRQNISVRDARIALKEAIEKRYAVLLDRLNADEKELGMHTYSLSGVANVTSETRGNLSSNRGEQ